MDISKRIAFIASQTHGPVLADIGCDHGYIACLAILHGKAAHSYACDVAKGPLDHARQTIAYCHLEDKVTPILSSGLEKVPANADQIVIAGMGGQLICNILSAAPANLNYAKSLLLSPHKDPELVRWWLQDHSWKIQQEYVVEDGSFYPVILAVKGDMQLEEWQAFYGIHVHQDRQAWRYLEDQKQRWQTILNKTPEDKQEKAQKRLEWIHQASEAWGKEI